MEAIHKTANLDAGIQFPLHPGPSRGRDTYAVPLPRVTQVMALALSFQDMISSGAATNYEELAKRAGVTAERLSQVMKLIWLAPSIQEEILYLPGCGGRHPLTEHTVRRIAAQWSWPEQLKLWIELKARLHLRCSSQHDGGEATKL